MMHIPPDSIGKYLEAFKISLPAQGPLPSDVTEIKVWEASGKSGGIKQWIGVKVSPSYWRIYWGAEDSVKQTKGAPFAAASFHNQAHKKQNGPERYSLNYEYTVTPESSPQKTPPLQSKPAPASFAIHGSPDWDF